MPYCRDMPMAFRAIERQRRHDAPRHAMPYALLPIYVACRACRAAIMPPRYVMLRAAPRDSAPRLYGTPEREVCSAIARLPQPARQRR